MAELIPRNHLTKIRKGLGYKVTDLAKKLGVQKAAIYKWERSETIPPLDKVIQLSEIYSITIDQLVGRNKPNDDSSNTKLTDEWIFEDILLAQSKPQLEEKVEKIIKKFRLKYFFFKQMLRSDVSMKPTVNIATNLPKYWIRHYIDKKYAAVDPTWDYSLSNNKPIHSDELFKIDSIKSNNDSMIFLSDLKDQVCPAYYTIPIHDKKYISTLIVSIGRKHFSDRSALNSSLNDMVKLGKYLNIKMQQLTERQDDIELSKKEAEVIRLVAIGKKTDEIAKHLEIKDNTVRNRIKRAKKKTGAITNEHLIMLAITNRLIPYNFGMMKINPENKEVKRI